MSRSVSEVSVVTVNWNGRGHLEGLLPSLIPLQPKEILVVDNGSSDGSVEFLRSTYPEVRLLLNPANLGFSHPNNRAAREARGRTLAFINNDMKADPQWLERGVERLQGDSVCVASRILNWEGDRIDFNGSSLQYLGYALQKDVGRLITEVSSEKEALFPCGGAMLIDRKVFLDAEGFDEDFFAVYEDVDLGWRLWALGYHVAFAPASVVYHRGHATFETQPNEKLRYLMHRNAFLSIFKNYEQERLAKLLPLAVVLAIKRAIRCSGVRKESFYLWENVKSRLEQGDKTAYLELTDSLNQLVALDDALELLPKMVEKRSRIQELRRRTDEEILERFEDPLRPIVADSRYIRHELEYLSLLGLEAFLKPKDVSAYRRYGEQLTRPRAVGRSELAQELEALQWLAGKSLLNPPSPPRSRIGKFKQVWQNQGLREALRLTLQNLRNGR